MGAAARSSFRNERRELRASLCVPVTLESAGQVLNGQLKNLSEGGAMVEASGALPIGNAVTLNCGSAAANGTVAWEHENCCGIQFDTPMDEAQIARQLLRSSTVAQRRLRLMGLPVSGH